MSKEIEQPCKWCGREMKDEFFILHIDRIVNGTKLFYADPVYLCADCYKSLCFENRYKEKDNA